MPLLVLHGNHGLTEKIEIDEIPVFRQLGKMRDSIPVVPEKVLDFPFKELPAGVGLRREGGAL